MFIKKIQDISREDIKDVGGKGASLGEMTKVGIPVPPGFVVTTKTYRQFYNQELPVDIQEEILKAFDNLNTERVAVRSSAVAEDSSSASWAGQMESYLNVTKDSVIDSIRLCWNSIHSERALAYAAKQNLSEDQLEVAVVVQKMVESESSGVIFSVNPISKNFDEVMIEGGFGLGEMVVQGMITPDSFIVDKQSMEIKQQDIQSQGLMLVFKDSKNQEVPVPDGLKDQAVLSAEQVKELTKLASKIEKHYGKPQDIEWALENGKLYILQSRPITTLEIAQDTSEKVQGKNKVLIKGLGAAPGIASGQIKVIKNLNQLGFVKKGDILVTEMTSPDFVEVFEKISAIITDTGGFTSHAAIISRELAIPAVVGTKKATELLKDGELVTIDGNKGVVYHGKVSLAGKPITEVKTDYSLKSTGDEIDDLINSMTQSVVDARELWPLNPKQLFAYFDLTQSLDMYKKLSSLISKGLSFKEIAGLFHRPGVVRYFLLNTGVIGLKAAQIFKEADIDNDKQIIFTRWFIEILKNLTQEDPFSLEGKNLLWTEANLKKFFKKVKLVKPTDNFKRKVNLLSNSLFVLNWSFFWDYYGTTGSEIHGPYKLPDNNGIDLSLIIKDYYNISPDEIWSLAKEIPVKNIKIVYLYEDVDIFISFANRILNTENLDKHCLKIAVLVDGQQINDEGLLDDLTKKIVALSKKQTNLVNKLDDWDKVRKGAQLAYYSLKDFYTYFGTDWYPEEAVEENIKKLGRKFLDAKQDKENRDFSLTRTMYDPRNDLIP